MNSTTGRAYRMSAAFLLLLSACSSSTDSGNRGIPWARLSGRLAYSREDCPNTCSSSLFILDASQQKVVAVKTLSGLSFIGLAWAPDGNITYAQLPSDGPYELHALSPGQGISMMLFSPAGPASWSSDGHAAYQCGDFTLCIDGHALDLGDFAVMLARPALSRDGARLVAGASSPDMSGLVAVNVSTRAITLLRQDPAGTIAYNPLFSPDEARIAFEDAASGSTKSEIWVMRADGSEPVQLTSGHADREPAWSPDGSEIAFFRDGNVFVMDADGGNVEQVTSDGANSVAWAP
jgi:Tol biopolymer transport system component